MKYWKLRGLYTVFLSQVHTRWGSKNLKILWTSFVHAPVKTYCPSQNCAKPHEPTNLVQYLARRTKIWQFPLDESYLCIMMNHKNHPNPYLYLARKAKKIIAFLTLTVVWGIEGIHRTHGELVSGETVSPVFQWGFPGFFTNFLVNLSRSFTGEMAKSIQRFFAGSQL